MSLITSIGGRQSTSFVTVSEADTIIQTLPDATTEWDALTTADKEFRLELAAMAMSNLAWKGRRAYCGQALAFPRNYGNRSTIPDEIKVVQVFIAYSVIHRGLANRPSSVSSDTSSPDATGLWPSKVSFGGSLSVSLSASSIEVGVGLDKITASASFPAYLKATKHLSQMRGRSVGEDFTCSTTTTTSTTTSTTTTSTTTTTTV